jgi:hypothetical protein
MQVSTGWCPTCGPDDDTLDGGPGFDVCNGGPGVNTFVDCEAQQ